jgi:calcium-independent phospholipase A2
LFRAQTQDEAMTRYKAFEHRLPNFVQMVKEMYNIPGIQKICDILTENPSWSITHLVAHFNLVEYLAVPQVAELIDYPDNLKYMTPFQLAIKSKNIEMVKILLDSAKLDHLDYNSSSIFHYAANTSKEMITILTNRSTLNLNHYNLDGYTPLHAACLSNNPDCVNALLCAGADVNISARHLNMQNRHQLTSSKNDSILFLLIS